MSMTSSPELLSGRYELIEELGQGGMATVYRAQDLALGRTVAIKRLHPHLARNPEHRARFEREARAVARQDHPGIVKIYDFSPAQTDDAYIVMELIEGESLAALVERCGPLPPELAAVLIADTLDALDVAHRHHIVHRDLKPENIMVRPDASIVILDFGLANLLDQDRITRTGALLGSPSYMAPELIGGGRANVATDLFAMGAIFYRLVTGVDAYQGHHPAQILRAIERGEHTPAHRVLTTVGRRISHLLSRWLSTDPGTRPATAGAALRELETHVAIASWREDLKHHINKTSTNTLKNNPVAQLEERIFQTVLARADALSASGDTPGALHEIERLLAYRPDSEEARARLGDLQQIARAPTWRRRPVLVAALALAGLGLISLMALPNLWQDHRADQPPASAPARDTNVPRSVPPDVATSDDVLARPGAFTHTQQKLHAALERARQGVAQAPDLDIKPPQRDPKTTLPADDASASPTPPPRTRRVPKPLSEVDRDASPGEEPPLPPTTLKQRFRVVPAAATLRVNGKSYSAIEAARGIELPAGPAKLEAFSPGCEPFTSTIDVGPESSQQPRRVVLRWLPGYIDLVVDRDALVWIDERSPPMVVSAGERFAPIEIAFGPADQSPAQRQVQLRIADRHDLTHTLKRTLTVRPGQTASLALTLADTSP